MSESIHRLGLYDAHRLRDGRVRYWSVYRQIWMIAGASCDIDDQDYAALDTGDRALVDTLPPQGD